MERIVVGVDGSPGAHKAVGWAAREAERWGATLVAVHAWAMPVMAAPTGLAPMPIVPELEDLSGPAGAVLDDAMAEVRAAHPDAHDRAASWSRARLARRCSTPPKAPICSSSAARATAR